MTFFLQMLDTAYGAGSCLAFHHFKKATKSSESSTVLVFTVDCRAVLKFAEKVLLNCAKMELFDFLYTSHD